MREELHRRLRETQAAARELEDEARMWQLVEQEHIELLARKRRQEAEWREQQRRHAEREYEAEVDRRTREREAAAWRVRREAQIQEEATFRATCRIARMDMDATAEAMRQRQAETLVFDQEQTRRRGMFFEAARIRQTINHAMNALRQKSVLYFFWKWIAASDYLFFR